MAYRVRITRRAENDLDAICVAIGAEHSGAALRWFLDLERAISRLEGSPRSWPSTPESRDFRHLLYGKKPHVYRIIYRILEAQREVEILHVRHGARDGFDASDLLSG